MESQHNNNISSKLKEYRGEIDQIDNQIIDLINQRMAVVAKVGKLKESGGDRFFIKSAREADMIKNLVQKADKSIPKSIIISIWRKLITSANVLEQEVKIAFHNPEQKFDNYHPIIEEYYADFVPIYDYSISTNVIAEIEKNNAQIGIFILPDEINKNEDPDQWWIHMANSQNGLKVFAKIPFVEYKNSNKSSSSPKKNLVAVAIKEAEKSLNDKTLLTIELSDEFSANSLLKTLAQEGFEAKIIKQAKISGISNISFYLVEIDGFFSQEDKKIKLLAKSKIKPHIKVIGNYPTSIIL